MRARRRRAATRKRVPDAATSLSKVPIAALWFPRRWHHFSLLGPFELCLELVTGC